MRLQIDDFQAELEKVLLWLPKKYPASDVSNILANLWLAPTSLPTTEIALEVYYAKLRAELAKSEGFGKIFPKLQTLKIPEKLVEVTRNFAEALLILLDGLQPQGLIDVEDKNLKLATCFCFEGKPDIAKAGLKVAEAKINFGISQAQKIQILADSIVRIPLNFGFSADVTVKTLSNFKIAKSKKITQKVEGSQLGIVFDARGRPITEPGKIDREERARLWRQAIGETKEFSFLNF